MGKGLNSITSIEDDKMTTGGINPNAMMADPNTADMLISEEGGTWITDTIFNSNSGAAEPNATNVTIE